MKKILGSLVIAAFFVSQALAAAGAGGTITPSSLRTMEGPMNCWAIKLGTCNGTKGSTTATGNDTLQNAKQNVYGPFNLSYDKTHPMAKYFQVYVGEGAIYAATESLQVSYSLGSGNAITDTTNWTIMDTITSAAKRGTAVDISGKAAISVFFKLKSISGSVGALIVKPVRIVFASGKLN